MAISICIASRKGGVGKTVTAINLSAALALAEKRTLLVDCDPQGHATAGVGIDKYRLKASLYHVLDGRSEPEACVVPSELRFLSVLPARPELARIEVALTKQRSGFQLLGRLLETYQQAFDYVIFDSPPSVSLLAANALTAAEYVLVPLQCEFFALEGLAHFLKAVAVIKQQFHPDLKIAGILRTMLDNRNQTSRHISRIAGRRLRPLVCRTTIPRDSRVQRAAAKKRPVVLEAVGAQVSRCYLALAGELIERCGAIREEVSGPAGNNGVHHNKEA